MTGSRLDRFVAAQADPAAGFDAALMEIRTGRKRGHWIWYVFPQASGLGTSGASQLYGIDSVAEAVAYLQHPVLGPRLITIANAVADHLERGARLETIMGSSIDARKLVSSLTLFGAVASELAKTETRDEWIELARVCDEILAAAAHQGYPPCRHTLTRLQRGDASA